jgi:hypothetical protein
VPRAALLSLLLLGACASLSKEDENFLNDRPGRSSTEADTGSCKPFFVKPSRDWGEGAARHSCWHRLWEVPAALVVVPVALAVVTSPVWVPILLLH